MWTQRGREVSSYHVCHKELGLGVTPQNWTSVVRARFLPVPTSPNDVAGWGGVLWSTDPLSPRGGPGDPGATGLAASATPSQKQPWQRAPICCRSTVSTAHNGKEVGSTFLGTCWFPSLVNPPIESATAHLVLHALRASKTDLVTVHREISLGEAGKREALCISALKIYICPEINPEKTFSVTIAETFRDIRTSEGNLFYFPPKWAIRLLCHYSPVGQWTSP